MHRFPAQPEDPENPLPLVAYFIYLLSDLIQPAHPGL